MEQNASQGTQQAHSFDEAFFSSPNTYIHPTAVVGPHVTLGENVKIGPFCVVTGKVTVGSNTRIYAHATIGFPGQVVGLQQSLGRIEIGNNCELREFVTIHASRYNDGLTKIGNNCYLMNFAHVSHDAILEDNVTLINNVSLGGHTYLEKNVIIMANSATHQFCRIGQFSALAPFSGIRQDLPPFSLFSGQPARFFGLNLIGLKRGGFSRESIHAIKHVTKLFYQDKLPLDRIQTMISSDPSWEQDSNIQTFIDFVKNSSRGISRKTGADKSAQHSDQELEVSFNQTGI